MARRVLWVLLCLVAGGPCAFLALEFIGVPIAALILATLIVIGRRNNSLAETLLGFGLTYAIEVFRVAASDLEWLNPTSGAGRYRLLRRSCRGRRRNRVVRFLDPLAVPRES